MAVRHQATTRLLAARFLAGAAWSPVGTGFRAAKVSACAGRALIRRGHMGAPHTCFACTRPDPTEPYAADGDGNDEDRPGPPRRAAPSSFGSSHGPEWPQPRDSRASGARE